MVQVPDTCLKMRVIDGTTVADGDGSETARANGREPAEEREDL